MLRQWQLVVGLVKTNCYTVADGDSRDCVVIDPGDDAARILALLRQENLSAQYIFLTHGHFDHILACQALRQETGALVVIHESDAVCLTDPSLSLGARRALRASNQPPDITVRGGETFPVGELRFTWLHTPGHTPGSACLLCGDRLFSGDTLFEDDCGRCDFPGGDEDAMRASLRLLHALPGNYRVYPGHDVNTTLDRERLHNQSMLDAVASAESGGT